jgi:hypothetical protein
MVVDIAESLTAESPANAGTDTVDFMPPMYSYIVQAALRNIHSCSQRKDLGWLKGAEDVLQTSLHKYFQRWSVNYDLTRDKMDTRHESNS